MITEQQRRALFALREALHLCEVAEVAVSGAWRNDDTADVAIQFADVYHWSAENTIGPADIDALLAEHPE